MHVFSASMVASSPGTRTPRMLDILDAITHCSGVNSMNSTNGMGCIVTPAQAAAVMVMTRVTFSSAVYRGFCSIEEVFLADRSLQVVGRHRSEPVGEPLDAVADAFALRRRLALPLSPVGLLGNERP